MCTTHGLSVSAHSNYIHVMRGGESERVYEAESACSHSSLMWSVMVYVIKAQTVRGMPGTYCSVTYDSCQFTLRFTVQLHYSFPRHYRAWGHLRVEKGRHGRPRPLTVFERCMAQINVLAKQINNLRRSTRIPLVNC